jgi:antitoxin (DNA-binding transcriptional repressor) of toxin-antitoxin stability system
VKVIDIGQTTLEGSVTDAQHERVVVTHKGRPIALIVGVAGMDEDQLQLESSEKFWTLIERRRAQKTISRADLEQRLDQIHGAILPEQE